MLRRVLEKEGWRVTEAENGRGGIECLSAEAPGLILLDLMMPVMDGFQFLIELRKVDDWRSIPVIVVTAKDLTDEDRRRLNGDVAGLIQRDGMGRDQFLKQIQELVAATTGD